MLALSLAVPNLGSFLSRAHFVVLALVSRSQGDSEKKTDSRNRLAIEKGGGGGGHFDFPLPFT